MGRYVVTGGAGFIGSHLVDRLLSAGHAVVALDNFCTGSPRSIAHLAGRAGFEFIEVDVCEEFPDVGAVEGVLDLACPASPVDFLPRAIAILQVNSAGVYRALEFCRRRRAWFLLASTSEVYGDPQVHPQREDYLGNVDPNGIRGAYDEGKRFAEAMTAAFRRTHGVAASVVRIFNTYGPRMRADDGRVIPNFISQALRGEALTVYGDGTQTRSLCYVDDLVAGLMKFVERRPAGPLNLGNDREVSVNGIADAVVRLTQAKGGLTYRPLPEGDPKQRCPDLARAKSALGWAPEVPMEEGLRRTIDYFRSVV